MIVEADLSIQRIHEGPKRLYGRLKLRGFIGNTTFVWLCMFRRCSHLSSCFITRENLEKTMTPQVYIHHHQFYGLARISRVICFTEAESSATRNG